MKKNKTLKRQLRKCHLDSDILPTSTKDWELFLSLIEQTYDEFDQGRYLLERSLEISSEEMREEFEKNEMINIQLMQTNKLVSLGTLASGVAHELTNPLAGIVGQLEVIKLLKDFDRVQVENRVDKCLKLTERMSKIINQMRRLSRDSKDDDFTFFSPLDIITNTFDLLGRQLLNLNIEYNVTITRKTLQIYGDQIRLESVIQNLVTNSLHAFEKSEMINNSIKKEINISIKFNELFKQCIISYQDNAGGMKKTIKEKIFDPFFTTKEVGVGVGIGMSITKQIIELHKGTIKCESTEGEGTLFEIKLPGQKST